MATRINNHKLNTQDPYQRGFALELISIATLRRIVLRLKSIPGSILILESIRKHYANKNKTIQVNDFDGSLTLELNLGEHMQSQTFWYGYYSRDIVMLMDNFLSPGMVVFDVGANIGEISLCAARRIGNGGQIYCFEPMPDLFYTHTRNLQRNAMTHAHPFQLGLANQDSVRTIYDATSKHADGTVHAGLGTLYPMQNRSKPVGTIQLTTLDSFCTKHHIKKLDLLRST